MGRHALPDGDREHGKGLGACLAADRRATGLSAQDVAVAAGLSIDTVRSLEEGRVPTPTFLTVARIAGVLAVSLDELHQAAQKFVTVNAAPRRRANR